MKAGVNGIPEVCMRRGVVVGLVVAGALLLIFLLLPVLMNADRFRPAIESQLSKSLGREVTIGNLKLSILSGTLTATDLSIGDDPSFSKSPFLSTKDLKLSIGLWEALFSHKLNISGMTMDAPQTVLIQLPSGVWNFSTMGRGAAQPASNENLSLSMKSLKINGARLSLTEGTAKPQILDNVNLQIKDFAAGSVFPFSLTAKIAGGGDLALDGKAGPIDERDAANTALTATVKITNLNLAATGAVPASSGIDGVVTLDGTAASNGQTLNFSGKLTADKLKLAPGATAARNPLSFDFALAENLKNHSGQLSRGNIAIGTVKGTLTGTWTQQGDSPVLAMVLSAPGEPVSGLEELLPALDIILPAGSALDGGTASAKLTLSGPASAMIVSGPISVRNTRLKGFDIGSKLGGIEKLAGIGSGPDTELQTLSANLRTTAAETILQDIRVVIPSLGDVSGAGIISASHALNFRMRATVRGDALVSSFAPSNVPFSIVGTSSNPQFKADVGAIAAEEIDSRLKGVKVGGVDAGQAAGGILQGLFSGKKK